MEEIFIDYTHNLNKLYDALVASYGNTRYCAFIELLRALFLSLIVLRLSRLGLKLLLFYIKHPVESSIEKTPRCFCKRARRTFIEISRKQQHNNVKTNIFKARQVT